MRYERDTRPGCFEELQKRLDYAYVSGKPDRLRMALEIQRDEVLRLMSIVTDVANWAGHGNDPTGYCWEHWRDVVREALTKIPATIEDADPTRRRWNATLPEVKP